MDNYQENGSENDRSWSAQTALSIGLTEAGGILLAYCSKFYSHYLEGVALPHEKGWADNVVIDGMINGLIDMINTIIRVSVPISQDFFRFFFSEKMAWFLIGLSLFGFIFSLVGLRSEKTKAALLGMLLCIGAMVFGWLILSGVIV